MIFNRLAIITALLTVASTAADHNADHNHDESIDLLQPVKISIQPAFHGIPIYAAKQFGFFEELGLDVTLSLYASGGPQVQDAVENQAWDFGIAGSVPCVIAGAKGIQTIGINNDESATTEVFGAPGITEWPTTQELYDGIFTATADSTGELLLRKCLEKANIQFEEQHIVELSQNAILKNLQNQSANDVGFQEVFDERLPAYGSLWAPNTYTYEEENNRSHNGGDHVKVMCSGNDVDFQILGGLMVREEYANAHPDIVARILAAYLRGVSFMQNKAVEEEVIDISNEFHLFAGIPVKNPLGLLEDLLLRPLFNLDQQLDALDRNFANNYESELDRHFIELEDFLFNHSVIDNTYLPKEYVTNKYMKIVSDDDELRAFSYYGDSAYNPMDGPLQIQPITHGEDTDGGVLIAGIVLCTIGIMSLIVACAMCYANNKKSQRIENIEKVEFEHNNKSDDAISSYEQQQQQQQYEQDMVDIAIERSTSLREAV